MTPVTIQEIAEQLGVFESTLLQVGREFELRQS